MEYRIKEILKEKGMSMEDLATELGKTRQNVTKIFANNPRMETLEKIAECLDINVIELFDVRTDNTVINCPHCGKKLRISITEEEG